MPSALTLENNFFTVAKTQIADDCVLPWEIVDLSTDAANARASGGFFDFSWTRVLAIEGADAKDFLQRMSTLDFRKLSLPSAKYGGFLTGRGTVVALGTFTVDEDAYRFWAGLPVGAAARHIEQFHFAEKFSLRDESDRWALFLVVLGDHPVVADLRKVSEGLSDTGQFRVRWLSESVRGWWDGPNRSRVWVAVEREKAPRLLSELSRQGFPLLGNHLYKFFRIREGIPTPGNEITDKEILLEGNLVWAADREKGCYPGQEVIERIFTYGSVNRKLFTLRLKGERPEEEISVPTALVVAGENAGTLRSVCRDPFSKNEYLGLAYIQKPYWAAPEKLTTPFGDAVRDVKQL